MVTGVGVEKMDLFYQKLLMAANRCVAGRVLEHATYLCELGYRPVRECGCDWGSVCGTPSGGLCI